MWVATTATFTLFMIHPRRGAAALKRWFPDGFEGTIHSDRWSAYSYFDLVRRQLCWSHLGRDLQAIIDAKGAASELAVKIREGEKRMFHAWHQYRDEELTWDSPRVRFSCPKAMYCIAYTICLGVPSKTRPSLIIRILMTISPFVGVASCRSEFFSGREYLIACVSDEWLQEIAPGYDAISSTVANQSGDDLSGLPLPPLVFIPQSKRRARNRFFRSVVEHELVDINQVILGTFPEPLRHRKCRPVFSNAASRTLKLDNRAASGHSHSGAAFERCPAPRRLGDQIPGLHYSQQLSFIIPEDMPRRLLPPWPPRYVTRSDSSGSIPAVLAYMLGTTEGSRFGWYGGSCSLWG